MKKFIRDYIGLNFLVWTGVALFDLAGDYFNDMLWDRPFQWREEIPFVTSWYTWFLLTPAAIALARRWHYARTPLSRFIMLHLCVYLLLNIMQVYLATWHINIVNRLLMNDQPFQGILYKTAISGTFYNFLIYAIMVLGATSIRHSKDLRHEQTKSLELESKLAQSRLEFLRQQLQPHFLFNTHHSIITLMKLGETRKAIEMMERLSELMRLALRETNEQEVTLAREVHLLELYLGIQQIRFGPQLEVEINVGRQVENALVPAMILQPLVENAIKYAVEGSSAGSKIIIDATAVDGQLLLAVTDHGSAAAVQKHGIGLSNTRERLEMLYGSKQQLSVKPHPLNKFGMEVIIKLPLHYA